jgi:general stress protein YciG
MKFDRAEHCRKIAQKGGEAVAQKYGPEHMSKIGRKGWESTTKRHFGGEEWRHAIWLANMGAYVYWRGTSLPMRYDRNGHPIYPETKPAHPSHKDYTEF